MHARVLAGVRFGERVFREEGWREGRRKSFFFSFSLLSFSLSYFLFLFWREGMACAVRGSGSGVIHGGGWYLYCTVGKVKYNSMVG